MNRVTIWVDCGNEKVKVIRKIENFLKSLGVEYTVVDVCEIATVNAHEK